jgi:hypothetical protein
MGLITDFYTRLKTYAGLTALIGTRVYGGDNAPDGVSRPYCVYSQVSAGRKYTHSGYAGIQRPRMQVNCYADTYEEAKEVAAQVTAAMESWPAANVQVGAAFQDNEVDLYDNETGLYVVPVDFILWYHG